MDRERPIGVFDSGVGGLTVVAALRRRLPDESILYLGDTARLPYGTKSARTVISYARRNVDFLLERGVKAVVVACNTASALALGELAAPRPVWGVIEPGAEAAVALCRRAAADPDSDGHRIGVLGTEATVRSEAYPRAIRHLAPEIDVVSQACPLFVPLVEEGWSDDPVAEIVARRYLEPFLGDGIGTLVLGCTHYPVLAPMLERVVGSGVRLVDSASAMAHKVAAELEAADFLATGRRVEHHLCVTDIGERFQRIAAELLAGLHEGMTLEWVEV